MEMEKLLELLITGFLTSLGFGIIVDLLMYGVNKAFHLVHIK